MSYTIFKKSEPIRQSFLQRLFKQEPPGNAVVELNNLLAYGNILAISPEQLRQLETKYGIEFGKDFPLNLEEFYAVCWNDYLKDKTANPVREAELAHLAILFNLTIETVSILQTKIGEIWYATAAKNYVANGRFERNDQYQLEVLRQKLRLPENIAEPILSAAKIEVFKKYAAGIIAKSRCTPAEENEAGDIAASLGISPAEIKNDLVRLKQFKYYWELENIPLKEIPAGSAIQKSESCYLLIRNVQWYEIRGSGGNKQYERINQGTLYLTNKRLVFEGNIKNSVIPYDRIVRISKDTRGIVIHKDKGKDPVLSFPEDGQALEIILKRLLKDSKAG